MSAYPKGECQAGEIINNTVEEEINEEEPAVDEVNPEEVVAEETAAEEAVVEETVAEEPAEEVVEDAAE